MSKVEILRETPKPLPQKAGIPITYSTDWTRAQARKDILATKDTLGDKAARERAEMQSLVLAQPHRRGNPSRKAGSPLWEFCEVRWGRDADWAHKMFMAGCDYEQIVRDSLLARGLPCLGQQGKNDSSCGKTEAELKAERERAIMKRNDADAELTKIARRARDVMENVCYWQREPGPYDEGILAHGLYKIAVWQGRVDLGINGVDKAGAFG